MLHGKGPVDEAKILLQYMDYDYDSLTIINAALLDYIPTTNMITFEPNEAEKLITVELVNDVTFEGMETFIAKLTAVSSNVQIGANAESVVVILDEEDGMYVT